MTFQIAPQSVEEEMDRIGWIVIVVFLALMLPLAVLLLLHG